MKALLVIRNIAIVATLLTFSNPEPARADGEPRDDCFLLEWGDGCFIITCYDGPTYVVC